MRFVSSGRRAPSLPLALAVAAFVAGLAAPPAASSAPKKAVSRKAASKKGARPAPSPAPAGLEARLKPLDSGPGVIVFEPAAVGAPADPDTVAFGDGCARWLHFTLGGHGELGKTPLWTAVEAARQKLGVRDLRLPVQGAARIASITGATHVAVGTVKQGTAGATLAYQLWQVPTRKAVGAPVTVTGTPEQIVAKLPGLARTLLTRLKVPAPRVPGEVGLGPDDVRLLGRVGWFPGAGITEAHGQGLRALAERSPLAGLLYVCSVAVRAEKGPEAVVDRLLAQAPTNPLVFGEIGRIYNTLLVPRAASLRTAEARFPRNYLLARTRIWLERARGDRAAERKAAERAVRCAPRNASAWLALGWTISQQAEELRRGRVVGKISPEEWVVLGRHYGEWLEAVYRATRLDPLDGTAWLRLASAATFAGVDALADAAFWKAARLEADKGEVFGWGLEMYQEKWGGAPEQLARVAKAAAEARYPSAGGAVDIAEKLEELDFGEEAERLLARAAVQARGAVQAEAGNAQAHFDLGRALQAQDKVAEAIPAFEAAAKLRGENAEIRYRLGYAYYRSGRTEDARREMSEAVRLNQKHGPAHRLLGHLLWIKGEREAAWKTLREAVRLEPDDPQARMMLAAVLPDEEAVLEYVKLIGRYPNYAEAHLNLANAFFRLKQYDQAVTTGESALRLDPEDSGSHWLLARAYRDKGDRPASLRYFRETVRFRPVDYQSFLEMGDVLWEDGQKAEARAAWEKVLTLQPNTSDQANRDARERLEKRS